MTGSHRTLSRASVAAAAAVCLASVLLASSTTAWEMNSYSDFIRGRFHGISLSREGRLSLAPKVDTVFSSDQPVIWSVAQGPDGSIYAATGHRGRVYRIDAAGKSSLLWTASEPEVFAIAVDSHGVVYAGTSPDGKVYRIVDGKASEYFSPQSRYIWSLAVARDGALYVGTGDQGKIFKVTARNQGELYYSTGQSHITGLAIDSQGRLLAGTEPNGILYRISGKDKAFVLYDANLPEIRAIVPMPDGTVYAAALGGSIARQTRAAAQAAQNGGSGASAGTAVTTTITVEAQSNGPGEIKPPVPTVQPSQPAASAAAQPATPATPSSTDISGVDKSAVYRINPDNTVDTLWSSKDENVYDLLALEKQILFSTDQDGRIYGLAPDRRVTLVTQTNEGETTRLLPSNHSILAATSDMGRIFRLSDEAGASGSYEAPVHDSGTASRWGSLSWLADVPANCSVVFRTRSGNSAKPDATWSDWSGPLKDPSGSKITSPNARYIQWKAELASTSAGTTPFLNTVTLAYLPQNSPPIVRSINVITQAVTAPNAKPAPASSGAFSVTVTDTDTSAGSTGTPTQTLTRAAVQQITLTWQAEDPDGDRLVYDVYFRGDDETQWKTLKSATHDSVLTFDADVLADGRYYFRVVASDRESNPPAWAREAQLVSAPVMIDNTPPVVKVDGVRYAGGAAHLEFEATDSASQLRRCEYSLDAQSWIPVESVDGVIDSLHERFVLDLPKLSPGEHLVVIRAADSANNTGTTKVVLK